MTKGIEHGTDLTEDEVLALSIVEKWDEAVRWGSDMSRQYGFILTDKGYPGLIEKGYAIEVDGVPRITAEGKAVMKIVNRNCDRIHRELGHLLKSDEPKRSQEPYPSGKAAKANRSWRNAWLGDKGEPKP